MAESADSAVNLKRQSTYQNVSSVEDLNEFTATARAENERVSSSDLESNVTSADDRDKSSSPASSAVECLRASLRPVPERILCSNDCGKVLENIGELERHLDGECPLTLVDCTFKHVGCEVRLPRRALPTHLAQAVVLHLSQQTEKYEERMKMLESDNERLAVKCKRLETSHKELEEKMSGLIHSYRRLLSLNGIRAGPNQSVAGAGDIEHVQYLNHADLLHGLPEYSILNFSPSPGTSEPVSRMSVTRTPVDLASRNSPRPRRKRSDTTDLSGRYINADAIQEHQWSGNYSYILTAKSQSNQSSPLPPGSPRLIILPANLTMTSFERHKQNDDHWVSQPFYTHSQGYKMCLRVTANGQGSGKGTHITVAVYLMKGEFDNQLEWPFKGDITIQLLNQQGDPGHFTRTIHQAIAGRSEATAGEKFISAWCIRQFKSHNEIIPKYLKDDSLTFHISMAIRRLSEPLQQRQLIETEV